MSPRVPEHLRAVIKRQGRKPISRLPPSSCLRTFSPPLCPQMPPQPVLEKEQVAAQSLTIPPLPQGSRGRACHCPHSPSEAGGYRGRAPTWGVSRAGGGLELYGALVPQLECKSQWIGLLGTKTHVGPLPLSLGTASSLPLSFCSVVASWSHHLSSPRRSCSVPLVSRALTCLCAPLARRGPGREVVSSAAACRALQAF